METITAANAEVDEKEMEIIQDCLGVPTILRHILEQFSTKELIKFTLVNKLWNFEARTVMKERGNLRANIWSEEANTCQQLAAFASALEKMRVIPFSGICVRVHHPHPSPCQSITDRSVFTDILLRLRLKYFAVTFCGEWKECEDCLALEIVATILADFCWVLEELSLHEGRYEFYEKILQGRMLQCLKTLEVKPGDFYKTDEPLTSAFIKGLVARAPNLQELHIDRPINFKENVLQGSSAVLVPTSTFRPLIEQVCEDLISSLRVNAMEILNDREELDLELLNWFVPMVLAASRPTLKSLLVDLDCALPLSRYGISLPNVERLYIQLKCEIFDNTQAAFWRLPRGLSQVFPQLNKCGMICHEGHTYLWLEQAQTPYSTIVEFY